MSNEQKPGDPADKAADGAFGGVQSHRAGYGDDKLQRLTEWLRAHPTATLASGEGALLLAENDRLRDAAKDAADHYADARAEIDRLRTETRVEINWLYQRAERAERIAAALREPSENVSKAVWSTWGLWDSQNHFAATLHALVRAAVAAAEQEVGG